MNYIDELLPDLTLQAPDVADTALRRALQLATQDLFRESDLWVQELSPIRLFTNLHRYVLRVPTGTRVARVDWVKLDERPLAPLESEDITENLEPGYHITNDEPHQFLVSECTQRGDIRLSVMLYPTPAATDLPSWLVHDFRTIMVNTALARIYGAPGSPWFDPNLAQLLAQQVEAGTRSGKRLTSNRKKAKRRTVRYGGL